MIRWNYDNWISALDPHKNYQNNPLIFLEPFFFFLEHKINFLKVIVAILYIYLRCGFTEVDCISRSGDKPITNIEISTYLNNALPYRKGRVVHAAIVAVCQCKVDHLNVDLKSVNNEQLLKGSLLIKNIYCTPDEEIVKRYIYLIKTIKIVEIGPSVNLDPLFTVQAKGWDQFWTSPTTLPYTKDEGYYKYLLYILEVEHLQLLRPVLSTLPI